MGSRKNEIMKVEIKNHVNTDKIRKVIVTIGKIEYDLTERDGTLTITKEGPSRRLSVMPVVGNQIRIK